MSDSTALPTTLHLVPTADPAALEACFSRCVGGDAVLLLDDGVLHAAEPALSARLSDGCNLFVNQADLAARGLAGAPAAGYCTLLADADFSVLLERYTHCVTWK